MPKSITILSIKDGRPVNQNQIDKFYSGLKDGRYLLEADSSKKRTNPQNRYYWGVVVWEIRNKLEQLGNDFSAEQVHEYLKQRFNSTPVLGDGGECLGSVGASTAEMSKEDFGIYIDKIIPWAQEFLELTIPLPNTQMEVEYE